MSNKNNHETALSAVSQLLDYVAEDRAESGGGTMVFKDSQEGRMHLLLDVLLTDTWEMALRKVAMATQEARPDIVFTHHQMHSFVNKGMMTARRRCGHFWRRLHGDESGLDLFWLMLAAQPGATWTYAGWIDRLTVAFNKMELTQIEEGLLPEATDRYHRWVHVAAGFPAGTNDPFKAVTSKEWGKAFLAERDREKDERARAAIAAERRREREGGIIERVNAAAMMEENARKFGVRTIRDLAAIPQDDGQPVADEDLPGVTVIAGEPKLSAPYKALIGVPTPFQMTPDVREVRDVLRTEFPHAHDAIDLMLGDLRPGEPLRFRPFCLVGEPGSGKSRLIRRLAEMLSAPIRRYDGAASADNAFGGTPKRWSTAQACFPLTAVAETKCANVIVMIDEVDKAAPGFFNGSLHQALMPFLERETSHSYPDTGFEIEVDLSWVCYAMTANDDSHLPKPLKDRLRIIRMPTPGPKQLELLCASVMADLAVEMNVPAAFLSAIAPDEMAVIAKAWGKDGSIRQLQKIVRGTVTARDQHASRH
jgi:hypothetical protein